MKTFSQFQQELIEFKGVQGVRSLMKNYKPITRAFTGLSRAEGIGQVVKGKAPIDKIAGAVQVAKPLAILPAMSPVIFDQGRSGSVTDKTTKYLSRKTSDLTGGRISNDPKTDIGKRAGDFIKKKVKGLIKK